MPPSSDFDLWRSSVAAQLSARSRSAAAYADIGGNLPHYDSVAGNLLNAFGNFELAQAAWLHGVDPGDFGVLESLPRITPPVSVLLEERNRLRSIAPHGDSFGSAEEGADLSRRLTDEVLPRITDARSILLFIYEQLDHVDPRGLLASWTLRFARNPEPFVVGEPRPEDARRDRHRDARSRALLLGRVVAVAAEYIGLWHAALVARNAAFLIERPDDFHRAVEAVVSDVAREDGLSQARIRFVSDILGTTPAKVRWEWLSVADIHRQLGDHWTEAWWTKRFDRTGFVAVECDTESDCYTILSRLHRMPFQPNDIRDFIGAPRRSGYQALHTVLIRGTSSGVPVHIFTSATALQQQEPTGPRHLENAQQFLAQPHLGLLRIFTPDGHAVDLPSGATVLNFAVKIHSAILLRLRGATVNRKPVSLTHRLQDGDVVWLDIGDTLVQQLPEGWDLYLPREARRKVWRAYRKASRPSFESAGRDWLRQQLAARGTTVTIEDDELDAVIEQAEGEIRQNRHDAKWNLRRLGMYAMSQSGVDIGVHSVDAGTAEALVAAVARSLSELVSYKELDIPPAMRGQFDSVVKCDHCRPLNEDEFDASLANRCLTVHRRNGGCPGPSVEIRSIIRQTQQRFFVIDTSNRVGICAEILSVFQRFDVDLVDLAAQRVGPSSAVIRIGTDILGVMRREAILRELNAIPGVIRVFSPSEKKTPFVENYLPPRQDAPVMFWSRANPFQTGDGMADERRFYGMTRELAQLHEQFQSVLSGNAGKLVYVNGPLKVGKTSLAQAFIRRLEADPLNRSLTHYHKTKRRTSWLEIAQTIKEELIDVAVSSGLVPSADWATVEDAIRGIRKQLRRPIMLVIDEIVGMLRHISDSQDDISAFLRFVDTLSTTSGVLLLLVGPTSTNKRMDPRLMKVLTDSYPLHVRPLFIPEVHSHLNAKKLGPAYQIRCSLKLASEIHALTRGNPFWVTTLGAFMYDLAQPRSKVGITFTREILLEAKELMFQHQRAFADRVLSPHDASASQEYRDLKDDILRHFVPQDTHPMTPADLYKLVIRKRSIARETFDDALEELRISGTLAWASDRSRRIAVQAPLLLEFLEYLYEIDPRGTHP